MDKAQAKKRILKLKKLIEKYRYAYHVLDRPLVSDAVNDSLKHELQQLEDKFPELRTSDSPTQRVGGKPLDKFKKVRHSQPMMSLVDAFSVQELKDWQRRNVRLLRHSPGRYFAEIKIDGLAVSLHYEKGRFTQGLTRGDGRFGEDVTQNLKTVEAIPLKIQNSKLKTQNFDVRGEVYMKKEVFERLNKRYQREGKPPLANPRNGAAGSIRQLDPKLAAERQLSFFAYDIIISKFRAQTSRPQGLSYSDYGQAKPQSKIRNLRTHSEKHQLLRELGFPVAEGRECDSLDQVEEFYQKILRKRDKLGFLIDGIWVGVNDNTVYDKLGSAGKAPRGALAYKFPAEQKTTLVKKIINQVGRSGKITPVAVMEPVDLAGSTVSRATLHNWREIGRKDVRIGDTVVIKKAGDIIPEVVRVIKELRPAGAKKLKVIRTCPNCGKKLVKRKIEQVDLFCPNKNCGYVRQRQLEHFVSKKGFDIDGLGSKILEQLMAEGLINDETDIFRLKIEDLKPLERFADKSAENLIKSIQDSREIPLARFIFSLGIRHIGEAGAVQIGQVIEKRGVITPIHFFEEMKKRSQDEWQKMYDIGAEAGKSIFEYFNSSDNQKKLAELTELGVKIVLPPQLRQTLKGKSLAITGSLNKMTREEAEAQIRLRGGQASSSISKETDYLVLGEKPGSKYDKAKKLGIKIIDERQFLQLLKS
jgi:DNA ligase (NAD+)